MFCFIVLIYSLTSSLYYSPTQSKKSVELWILALGGAGIVAGLSMWGYRIIAAIGQKLTKLTPSRGFCIELGAAICVIFASRVGLPVSTTHCQVGATMGVGLAEFKVNTVNWKQFFFIFVGWVFTLIFTGLLAAGMFALLVNAPTAYNNEKDLNICPGDRLFTYDEQLKQFRGIACSGRV
jgi:phosphate/sulfate permease